MVKMVRDASGRFAQRPYYMSEELDRECEQIVTAFLTARRGEACFPITTDELSVLIETEGADLDSCVDLSRYGDDVEGVTAFYADREPDVMISDRLANDLRRENRFVPRLHMNMAMSVFTGICGPRNWPREICLPSRARMTTRRSASATRS